MILGHEKMSKKLKNLPSSTMAEYALKRLIFLSKMEVHKDIISSTFVVHLTFF